jgi:hypothetical protein
MRSRIVAQFNADEEARIDKLLERFPADKAARLKTAFFGTEMVVSEDPAEQAEINDIYAARAKRYRASRQRGSLANSPKTVGNRHRASND